MKIRMVLAALIIMFSDKLLHSQPFEGETERKIRVIQAKNKDLKIDLHSAQHAAKKTEGPLANYLSCYKALVAENCYEGPNYLEDADKKILTPATRNEKHGFYLYSRSGALFQPFPWLPARKGTTLYFFKFPGGEYRSYTHSADSPDNPGIGNAGKDEEFIHVEGKEFFDSEAARALANDLIQRINSGHRIYAEYKNSRRRVLKVDCLHPLALCRSVPDDSVKQAVVKESAKFEAD